MDLTFEVSIKYCSLRHQTLLPSPVTSTTGCCFHFGSVSSFFLELFLHWSPAYWAPTDLGSSSFSVLSFCLFILFMGFTRQEFWSRLPFPSPVDYVLSEHSTMSHLSWVALHGMTPSFIELDKAVVHVIRLLSFLWLWFSVCLPSDGEGKRLMEASWWERLIEGEMCCCSDAQGHAQFSSVQLLSRVWLFATPWIAARQASLSITNSRSSPRFTSIESVMPSSHLILCCPLLLLPPIPPSMSLFQWVNSSHEVAKVLEFQL